MTTTETPEFTPLPAPIVKLDHWLRGGLIDDPGGPTLKRTFGRAATVQLELAVDAMVRRLGSLRAQPLDPSALQRMYQCASAATYHLRRAGDVPASRSARSLAVADHSLARTMAATRELGPAGANATALLVNTRIHVRFVRSRHLGELPPTAMLPLLRGATRVGQTLLSEWRQWSDNRFGPIICARWNREGEFCQQLGYEFRGTLYPIRRAGERVQHRQWEWTRLAASPLAPLFEAQGIWRRLIGDYPAGGCGAARPGEIQ
jgi:hypothetical protein